MANAALYFDGSDDYVLVNRTNSLKFGTGDFSASFWFYSGNPTGAYQYLISNGPALRLNDAENGAAAGIAFWTGSVALPINNVGFVDGRRHHIVVERSGNALSLYFDIAPVPIPGAIWLMGAGLVGLVGLRRRFSK